MHKTQFLDELLATVCAAADAELAAAGRSTAGCPYIERWISHYRSKDSRHLERALHKYAPESTGIASARDYIPIVSNRMRRSVAHWVKTGQLTGVPEDLKGQIGLGGLTSPGGSVAGVISGIGSAISGAIGGIGKAIGSLFFKAKDGGPASVDPDVIQSRLGPGQPLDSSVRQRMEPAFGHSFTRVRVHNDENAGELSADLNAKAFTLGEHVAFGSGEYQPGTIVGDALIAHELAHVAQQAGAEGLEGPSRKRETMAAGSFGSGESDSLENDADESAFEAVTSLWSGTENSGLHRGAKAAPRVKGGLQLQRCHHKARPVSEPVTQTKKQSAATRFRSEALVAREAAIKEAGDLIRGASSWAEQAANTQGVPEDVTVPRMTTVVGLEPAEGDSLNQAVKKLDAAMPPGGASGIEKVLAALDKATAASREARKYSGSDDQEFRLRVTSEAIHAKQAAEEATDALAELSDRLDGTEIAAAIDTVAKAAEAARGGDADALDSLKDSIEDAKRKLRDLQTRTEKRTRSLAKIRFLVAAFLEVNGKGPALDPADVAKFKDSLSGGVLDDFSAVFGETGLSGFTLFNDYAPLLAQQLNVRAKMEQAGAPSKSPVPGQGDAEAYFKALVKAKNEEVFQAYMDYAQAFFYHRGRPTLDDLKVDKVEDLFGRSPSITGTRPLVCTGYALVGAHLLRLAGARLISFEIAVRATVDDIKADKIDEAHAIAILTRNGQVFIVSNYLIVFSRDDAIGPNAVAWEHKEKPLRSATGGTIPAAHAALLQTLIRLRGY